MGDIVKPDCTVSLETMHHLLKLVEEDWEHAPPQAKFKYAREGCFYLIAFCGALLGEEVPMVDQFGIAKHWGAGGRHRTPHVIIALLGRFKSEIGERYHLIPLAAVTKSGLKVRAWVGRLLHEYRLMGITHGPLFRDSAGSPLKASEMEEDFFARLEKTQDEHPELIAKDVVISEEFGIYRSFRRGATLEATNRKVPKEVIEANNRWHKINQAEGRQAGLDMKDHYTDVRQIIDHLIEFSLGL
jgi:hypothetical protein